MKYVPGLALLALFAVARPELPLASDPNRAPKYCGCPALCPEFAREAGMITPEEIQFWRAIHNTSTASSLVVVTVTDVNTGLTSTYCTGANFLLGAIHREYGLSYENDGSERAVKIAMAAKGSHFMLQRKSALRNIRRHYTAQELMWARDSIAAYANDELVKGFSVVGSFQSSLRRLHPFASNRSFTFAMGHALYERALSVGQGCVSGELWICN